MASCLTRRPASSSPRSPRRSRSGDGRVRIGPHGRRARVRRDDAATPARARPGGQGGARRGDATARATVVRRGAPPRHPTNESCSECGTSPLPASRTLPCGHPANACRECLDRKLLDGVTAARARCRAPLGSTVARAQLFEASRANRADATARILRLLLHRAELGEAPEALDVLADVKRLRTPDVRDSAGATPLMIACDFDAVDAARVLLTAGASTSARDAEGLTPLHRVLARLDSARGRCSTLGRTRTRRTTRRRRPRWSPRAVNDAVSLRALLRAGADLGSDGRERMDGGGEGGGEGGMRRRRPRHLGMDRGGGRGEASGFVGGGVRP